MYRNIILPASILAGTIIGAGIFSLPFIFQKAGLSTSFFYLAFFSLIYIFIYLMYADLIVRTFGDHRFVGYARMYLGEGGFWASLLIGLMQLFLVLTIYLILAPSFSKLFFPAGYLYNFFGFWVVGSMMILSNTRRIAFLEFLITSGIAIIILLIFGLGIKNFLSTQASWNGIDFTKFFIAGPILFSLSGTLAVPEVVSYFRELHLPISFIKKSLALGAIIPAILYALFVAGILGLSSLVAEDAVSGLAESVPNWSLALIGFLGFLSLISSYIVVGLNARRILEYDLLLPSALSKILVIFTPPLFYLAGFKNFIQLISFIGLIFLPIESIFIIFMWLWANKKLETPPILVGSIIKNSILPLLLIFFMVLIYVLIK